MGTFWVGLPFPPNFVFQDLNVLSTSDLIMVCVALGALTFISEVLRTLRDLLFGKAAFKKATSLAVKSFSSIKFTSDKTGGNAGDSGSITIPPENPQMLHLTPSQDKSWTWLGLLACSTALHMVYVLVSYSLMLALMSLNAFVFAALVLGSALAHFLLLPLRNKTQKNN